MNDEAPRDPTPKNPPSDPPLLRTEEQPPESGGVIALRAFIGFFAYVSAGMLVLPSRGSPIFVALVLIAAVVTAVKGKYRGFALGVFIGLGLTLLAVGVCFAIASNMKF